MKRYPILELCARVDGHTAQHQLLHAQCKSFDDWQGLLIQAEHDGMAPLLRKHLAESASSIPPAIRRSLNILYKRHQKKAAVRLKVLEEILILLQQHQLTPMLLKGAALCQTLYADPALRPMRDMDILLAPQQIEAAQDVLMSAGFTQASTPVAPGHYHLKPLNKTVEGFLICIELHQGLYPDCPPYYPQISFNNLLASGREVRVGAAIAKTFSHEETLHYLYQHGLHAPLPYETSKLINVADIIGYTEKYFHEINWSTVKDQFPKLYRALPLLGSVSPWDDKKIPDTFIRRTGKKLQPVPFYGWPQRRVKELERKVPLKEVLNKTFLPSSWWLRVYYGAGDSTLRLVKALCIEHPKNVLWWIHVYSHFVIETDPAAAEQKGTLGSLKLFCMSSWNKVRGILRKARSIWQG